MSRPPQQTGGKLIGEGVYGCAFDPPLICKGNSKGKGKGKSKSKGSGERVGKIVSPDDANAEYEASLLLKKISNAQDYFILIDELCTPLPRSKQTEKDLGKCKAIHDKPLDSFLQVSMPFGGKPLSAIRISPANIDLWQFGKHLLEAGTLMLLNEIVHFDLHRGNVLMTTRTSGRLIDFGLTWSPNKLTLANVTQLYRTFNPAIIQEPPEISIMNEMLDPQTSLENTVNKTIKEKKVIGFYSTLFRIPTETLEKVLSTFVATSWSFQNKHWYSFYKLYWTKMDSWAFGVMLLGLYNDLLRDRAFLESETYLKNKSTMENVLRHLCWVDAGERWDCIEALAVWAPASPLLQNVDVMKWRELKKEERAKLGASKIL